MTNYKAVIEYDGTGFSGFQIQPEGLRTIQGEIVKALSHILNKETGISYAGRTDSGVHATNQVISFKCDDNLDLYKFKWSLNCLLPEDISVRSVERVSDTFNSRRDAIWREYSYFLVNDNYQSVFLKRYSILVCKKLDFDLMAKSCKVFIGKKDFTSFCSPNDDKENKIREVFDFDIFKNNSFYGNEVIIFKIKANSFLYNMVRIIVGTLIEIGKGIRNISTIEDAFKHNDRNLAGKIVEPKGLFLTGVGYK
ncbi:tRNA pseudouridine(38-40) synthase TruA [bacterium]|nr:tRNA pseudouridine(38-40) synthase TruA [bacterium]